VTELIQIIISIPPVFIFLAALVFLDSYKLVKLKSVLKGILIGCVVALIAWGVNRWLFLSRLDLDRIVYSRYGAPIVEEVLKGLYILYLINKKKIGFMVDGAIYGFAVGAGFACIENIYYLQSPESTNLFFLIIRGFGTAVMHGGTTCMLAIILKNLSERYHRKATIYFVPGLIAAIVIHSYFNHDMFHPLIKTATQLVALPVVILIVFTLSERALREWLEVGLDTDVRLLEYILGGNIAKTKIGDYFLSLRKQFSSEVLADMLCFLRIHLELAIRAKGFLLLHGAGFRVAPDLETKEKFNELRYLEKNIGATGKLAISPLLHTSTHDLWQLYFLKKK